MPNGTSQIEIRIVWINYIKSVQSLLVPQLDDRSLDQYLELRNTVLELVQRENFLTDLNTAWESPNDPLLAETRNVLLMELKAFLLAAEVVKATEKPEEAKNSRNMILGRASTVTGSVKDLLDNLPPYAKAGLTLLSEVINLFKGKD